MSKIILFFLFLFTQIQASSINIAAAANLSYSIKALEAVFTKHHPDIHLKVTLGGSGKMSAQIMHGAPYGLFLSADMDYPQKLYTSAYAITEPKVYTKGAIAFFTTKEFTQPLSVELLTSAKISKIAIANPKTAPYGRATVEALKKSGVYSQVKQKFIYGESISQTLVFASSSDIGVVALSALYSPQLKRYKEGKNWALVDSKLYTPIAQGMVLLQVAKKNPDYKLFYDFILSKEAQDIFAKNGYLK